MSESTDSIISVISESIKSTVDNVRNQIDQRLESASNELHTKSQYVLRGTRSGRVYKIPNTYGKTTKASRELLKGAGKRVKGSKGQYYRASAPGEAPAVRTGSFKRSWVKNVRVESKGNPYEVKTFIESKITVKNGALLGDYLENGTKKMKPRPYKKQIIEMANPKIEKIFKRPYV